MDNNEELEKLNYEEAKQYVGGVVFVSILMVVGIIGNIHVLFIYTFRMKPSNHRIFILSLGVLDLITCIIGMPFIIVDLRNPLTFTMVSACKILRFVNYFICISSAFILIVIAIDRYRKICVPLGRQISQGMAKLLCLGCLCIALVLSWPAPVLYGQSSVNTTNPNITGIRCYTEDRFTDTKYQAYFNAVLILVVFVVFGILVVLYSLIGRQIRRHAVFRSTGPKESSSDPKSKMTDEESSEERNDSGFKDENRNGKLSIEPVIASTDSSTSTNTKQKQNQKPENNDKVHFNRVKRTTFMLFLITIFFFISYFPHLILKIVTFVNKDFVVNMTFTGQVLYNTFVWCFFINNMVNCFIYGFCDLRFRTEVRKTYNKILCRNK